MEYELKDGDEFLMTLGCRDLSSQHLGERSETEEPLVAFHKIGGMVHSSSRVEILHQAARVTELPLLVGFGWYLVLLMQIDSGVVTAAIAGGA